MSDQASTLLPRHQDLLDKSAIHPDVARERKYRSVTEKVRLEGVGIAKAARTVPGLMIPICGITGVVGFQYRPDEPRMNAEGKPVRYETPWKQANHLDIHPRCQPHIGDPAIPVIVTEGMRKVDALISAGAPCVIGLTGVWNWRGTNPAGGKVAIPDWQDVALNGRTVLIAYDHDVMRNPAVQKAARALADFLRNKGAVVGFLWVPMVGDDEKTGVDDWLADGGSLDDLLATRTGTLASVVAEQEPIPVYEPPPPSTLDDTGRMLTRWLGDNYDLDAALAAAICTASPFKSPDGSDVPSVLIVSGSGFAKTETVNATELARGVIAVSSISGESALLSATSERERSKTSTGGILRQIGDRGVLLVKDVTTILSKRSESRAELLGAFREVADGRFTRSVGVDGGSSIEWRGRCAIVGAVTTAWDTHHAVISQMGDRFLLVRMDSNDTDNRLDAGRQSLDNSGSEQQMRAELARALSGLIEACPAFPTHDPDGTVELILAVADLVTRVRTAVDTDAQGVPTMAHALEGPTRLAKYLLVLHRGARAMGLPDTDADAFVVRVARDCLPPKRWDCLRAVYEMPGSTTYQIGRETSLTHKTADRTLQALQLLGVVYTESAHEIGEDNRWRWHLSDLADTAVVERLTAARQAWTVSAGISAQATPGAESFSSSPPDGQENRHIDVYVPVDDISAIPPEADPASCLGCGGLLLFGDIDGNGLHPTCNAPTQIGVSA